MAGAACLACAAGAAAPRAAEAPLPRVEPATAAQVLAAVREPGASAVVVNLWATWCVPCVEEFPDLLRLRSEYGERGLRLVLVSLDFGEGRDERVRGFLRERGVDFVSYLKQGADEEFLQGLDEEWSGTLPSTLVYDGRGERRALIEGQTTHARLVEEVSRLIQ